MKLLLGSQSPRRLEILQYFNLPFEQVSSDFDEESFPFDGHPVHYVSALAKGKAESLAARYPSAMILTADTIVYREGKIYGKPKDDQEAFSYLKELVGQWHEVYTGLALYTLGNYYQGVEETKVLFNALTDEQITAYHQALPISDKAGGYMIQGAGGLIVNRIDGCYYNVMGLPINTLSSLLKKCGIDLWRHLAVGP